MDIENIKQINLRFVDPNGKVIIATKYINIDTNEEVDASVIAGRSVEKIDVSCAGVCST